MSRKSGGSHVTNNDCLKYAMKLKYAAVVYLDGCTITIPLPNEIEHHPITIESLECTKGQHATAGVKLPHP